MSVASLGVLGALVGTGLLVAVVTAVRRPAVRRLAGRSAVRRPAETALVTIGALLGTAIITGSLIVGDSLDRSIRSGAFTRLGPVDETVTAPGADALPDLRRALAGLEEHPAVDGVTFGLRATGTAAARVRGGDPATQPDVGLLQLDFDDAAAFGGDPQATGLERTGTPERGDVAISSDLATELEVTVGDGLTVFAYGDERRFRVDAVLPRVGLAGYSPGLDARSFNLFLPPGTLEELATDAPQRAAPPVAMAFVSNRGGVLAGVERSDPVTDLLERRIEPVPRAEVTAAKEQLLDTADEISSRLSEVFLGIGAFAVIAGLLLLVNVFVMLAQERRNELGIMRAVGMQRRDLVRAFFLEGTLYATAAAVLGAALGIGVGAAIMRLAQDISGGPATFTLDLRFAADTSSIAGGLLVGLLISLVTVVVTSIRISRLNIIRAIRDLPRPTRRDRGLVGIVLGALGTAGGLAITVPAMAQQQGAGALLGPAVLAAGLTVLLRRAVPATLAVTVLGTLVVAWGVAAPTLMPAAFRDADVIVFVVQGLVITGAAVAVLARNQDTLGRLIRRAAGGTSSVTARLGLAYPLARPFRTTMTLAMYALVIFTLVLVSLLAQVFGGQVDAYTEAESGGYDLLVRSAATDPLPPEAVRELDTVGTAAPLRHAAFAVEFRAAGHEQFRRWFASGYDRRFLRTEPPALDRWLGRFADERAVWRHVLDDPSAMIVGSQFLREGGRPQRVQLGDEVDIRDPLTGATDTRTVVATMQAGFAFSGAFMSEDSLVSVLGPRVPASRMYVAVEPGASAQQVARTLEQRHVRNGVEARTFRAIVAERQQQNRQFFRILQGYLLLGLLVGTAGLGVVMIRAVRERRREIGLLRAVGLQRATVGRSFRLEAAFITFQGIAVGASLATATAYQLVSNAAVLGGLDVEFQVPWAEIVVLLGITVLASLLAAGWPAHRAGDTPPAVARRATE